MPKIMYSDVKREHFDKVSDKIYADSLTSAPVTVYYEGTNLYGRMTIDCSAGNTKAYNKALQIVTEILTEKKVEAWASSF